MSSLPVQVLVFLIPGHGAVRKSCVPVGGLFVDYWMPSFRNKCTFILKRGMSDRLK
jgi:hypothetical protein